MRSANSDSAIAPASASMCPASDSSASECENQPPAPSTTVANSARKSVIKSLFASPSRSGPGEMVG